MVRGDPPLRRLAMLAAVGLLALPGCQFPRDPEGTLDRVEGGTMRVGVIDSPPWTNTSTPEPSGVEPELIRRFAEQLDAEIEWVEGTEAELVEAMKGFQLDVVVGGLDRSSPYSAEVALTRPYVDTEIELGVPPGTGQPDELEGMEVWVERGSPAAALLRQEEDDAVPRPYERAEEVDGPALVHSWELDPLGLESVDYILRDYEHAMAVPMGENAFMVELEHFLLDRGEEAEDLLHREVHER